MIKRLTFLGGILLILVVGAYLIFHKSLGATDPKYDFASVTKGDIENTVSATGTLAPVTSVEVGTQVSGTIDSVYVDFNDKVREGQILAVLDTTLLRASVLDAEANLERNEAQLQEAQYQYDQSKRLFDSSFISESDRLNAEVSLKSQKAALKSAKVALDRARRNLQYAVIKSPISGVVINRNVEAGQTVAASLSTPTLFDIAENMERMQILVDVDESDIGQIKEGQDVQFEVAAHMNKEFQGKVKQVRLQPRTVSNVVTYTVVVEANNDEGLLLPGMTATVSFVTEKHSDVLLIPSKALKFQPAEKELEAFRERRKQQFANAPDSAHGGGRMQTFGGGQGGRMGGFEGQGRNGGGGQRNFAMVWYLDSLGQLNAAPVRTGMTDKTNTEIVGSRFLSEGMKIIAGTNEGSAAKSTTAQQGPPGPGGGIIRMRGF